MKVFNLGCSHDHRFEGWFGSAADFETQRAGGRIECPLCGDTCIRKLPAAPRLNLSSIQDTGPQVKAGEVAHAPTAEQLQTLWWRMAKAIRENTEDVGERFAEEARRMHYEEAPSRGIRGTTTRDEAEALADEGIEVFSFPLPKGANEPLQ